MVRHIPNHILSHNSMKKISFGIMLMSKTLSKSQFYLSHFLRHHSTSNSYFWDIIMSKTISKPQLYLKHSLSHKHALDTF